MRGLKILHAADFHLDSPFEGLSASKAALRRGEQRDLLARFAALAQREKPDIVLLSGDIFDSSVFYAETGEELVRCLRSISSPVFVSPGNHDYYSMSSPWARLPFPDNVHVFRDNAIKYCELPALSCRVYGAAFTSAASGDLLQGKSAPEIEGITNVLCLHGEIASADSLYGPVSEEEIACSGMDYIAFGHVHADSGLRRSGKTFYAWPGCPEGRGFDETGEKYVYITELGGGECSIRKESIAARRYEVLHVDVTSSDPLVAVNNSLADETMKDIYRIILTGETAEAPDMNRLKRNLSEYFFALQLRDETRRSTGLWDGAGSDSLRGIFLGKMKLLYDSAQTDSERRSICRSVAWGLAALDNREEVSICDNP